MQEKGDRHTSVSNLLSKIW